jgi:hypothetical protein
MEAIVSRRSIFTILAVAAVAVPAVVAPALVTPAAAEVDVHINFGPPAPRYEPTPAPRAGYTWAPGTWIWSDNRHVWRAGYWLPARPGYRYVPERWESYWVSGSQKWRHVGSRWDRDGDGIPNRYDRDRDGDGIANQADRHPNTPKDRDHDGVPNYYDRKDNNPRRW